MSVRQRCDEADWEAPTALPLAAPGNEAGAVVADRFDEKAVGCLTL